MGPNSQELALEHGKATPEVDAKKGAGNQSVELQRVRCYVTEPLFKRILRRMFPDARGHERHPSPPLVAYLGTANASRPYELGNISLTGLYLLTDERWMAGTEMPITLQAKAWPPATERNSFTVQATVVRCGEDGVGFSILLSEEDSQATHGNSLRVQWVTRAQMEKYLSALKE